MENCKNPTLSVLLEIMASQSELLDRILLEQKIVHSAVTAKDWESLETSLYRLNNLSSSFAMLEDDRLKQCGLLANYYGLPEEEINLYKIVACLPIEDRKSVLESYQTVHQKLTFSKIKNNALNDYIRITREFLQGVFDSVIPQRRNVVYSRTGIVKSEPERLVLDTLL